MKTCTRCKIEKDESNFGSCTNCPGGLLEMCKECKKKIGHEYYINNTEKVKESNNRWKEANRDNYLAQQREYAKEYSKTPAGKYQQYKGNAKTKDRVFEITFDEFMELWQKPCTYCKTEIKTIGIDRVDSQKGYVKDNIVPCCDHCNVFKSDMPQSEFIELCKLIASRFPDVAE